MSWPPFFFFSGLRETVGLASWTTVDFFFCFFFYSGRRETVGCASWTTFFFFFGEVMGVTWGFQGHAKWGIYQHGMLGAFGRITMTYTSPSQKQDWCSGQVRASVQTFFFFFGDGADWVLV